MIFKFNDVKYEYKPKIFSTIVSFLALLVLLSLAGWQILRLQWKTKLINERIAAYESQSLSLSQLKNPSNEEFQRVFLKGKYLNDFEMYMPALSKNGNNGFHIIVPFLAENGENLIFDTGWVPLKLKEKDTRRNYLNNKEGMVQAIIRLPGKKGRFQPDNEIQNNFWFFVEPELMSKYTGIKLEKKFYLEAFEDGPNGYPLGNQTRIYIRNNHLQYAITWFLIACGLVGVYIAANVRKVSK